MRLWVHVLYKELRHRMIRKQYVLAMCLLCGLLGFLPPAYADIDVVHSEFELKLALVDQKIEEGLVKLYAGYLQQLDLFERKYMQAGDLNRTLVFRTEKEGFVANRKVDASALSGDPDLLKLQQFFLKHYNRADALRSVESSKLVKQYLVVLRDRSKELTKAGKIQEAIIFKTERDEVTERYTDMLASAARTTAPPGPEFGSPSKRPTRPSHSLRKFKTRFPHIASSLKVYYDFEDPSGVVDLVGNVQGRLKGAKNVESGRKGRGLDLDGNGWVSLGRPDQIIGMKEGAICFWIKTSKSSGTMVSSFVRSSRRGFRIKVSSSGKVVCALGYDSSYYSSSSSYGRVNIARSNQAVSKGVVNDGQWHHIAMVKDTKRIYVYVDGEKGSSSYTERSLMDPSANFRLSGYSYYSESDGVSSSSSDYNPFVGQMDDFMIFDRPMTDQMVKSIYTSQR
jgi:hypothetical protein